MCVRGKLDRSSSNSHGSLSTSGFYSSAKLIVLINTARLNFGETVLPLHCGSADQDAHEDADQDAVHNVFPGNHQLQRGWTRQRFLLATRADDYEPSGSIASVSLVMA